MICETLHIPKEFLKITSGVLGLTSAGFWWYSASIDIPVPDFRLDGYTPPDDMFSINMKKVAGLNKMAAILTGCAVFLSSVSDFC